MENKMSVSNLYQSPTNPRGEADFKGQAFDDLVASVREKGVIVPLVVRYTSESSKTKPFVEVIAGNRRLRAAQVAGVTEVPVRVIEASTDEQVREIQIIENLHRADVHPLEEAEAYRALVEKSKPRYTTADVAAKVGKSETYVRQRLALTNLTEKSKKAYRAGKISPSVAVLLARIEDAKIQDSVLKDGSHRGDDTEWIRRQIQQRVFKSLQGKPWANDAKLAEAVGDKAGHESLFGDKEAGIDPVAFATQMAAFIELKTREAKKTSVEMVRISTDYGRPETKGVLARDSYRILHNKEEVKAASEKKQGIVAEGNNLGQIFWITTAKDEIKESAYRQTPKEKAARKKEIAAAKAKKEADAEAVGQLVAKAKWPLTERQLDVLLDLAINAASHDTQRAIVKRRGIDVVVEKHAWGDYKSMSGTLEKLIESLGSRDKVGLMLEALAGWKVDSELKEIYKKL